MALEDYAERFETVRFHREDGILQVTFHTDGDSLRWGAMPVREMQEKDGEKHCEKSSQDRL